MCECEPMLPEWWSVNYRMRACEIVKCDSIEYWLTECYYPHILMSDAFYAMGHQMIYINMWIVQYMYGVLWGENSWPRKCEVSRRTTVKVKCGTLNFVANLGAIWSLS